ncbi:hypothetical protein FRX31_012743 [Thalictrum thalictroides]|uniref:Uncharacterized protein n=1 Tax=Thalictrum thalictroides TaxID=46969 RepID=A0A7J6WM42_THATH|nr:hypothetical protein FRX31_012743 [Thalictrum thalictroides]
MTKDEKSNNNQITKIIVPPYMKAFSGAIGGIAEASCLQPIDKVVLLLTPFAAHLTLKYALRLGTNAMLQKAFKDSETGVVEGFFRVLVLVFLKHL